MAEKLKAWRHEQELDVFLEALGETAYKMYVAQKNHGVKEFNRCKYELENLRGEFYDKFELDAGIAIEIERVDREAWVKAQMA